MLAMGMAEIQKQEFQHVCTYHLGDRRVNQYGFYDDWLLDGRKNPTFKFFKREIERLEKRWKEGKNMRKGIK
jgi:hypothetical protein